MEPDLAGTPTIVPKFGLHGSGIVRRSAWRILSRCAALVWNLVLFSQPSTHIDQAAAIAAERAVGRIRRPFHRPPTRGTLDDGYHPGCRLNLRAAGEKKR